MAPLIHLIIFCLLFTSLPYPPTFAQTNAAKNQAELEKQKDMQSKTRTRSEMEKRATGRELDAFTSCKINSQRGLDQQQKNLEFLRETDKLRSKEVTDLENELKQKRKELIGAREEAENLSGRTKEYSTKVIDKRERLIREVEALEKRLDDSRKKSHHISTDLKKAEDDELRRMEEEKLKSSTFKIFELTTNELKENGIAGSSAESNLQMMALATSAVNHLECSNLSSTESKAYHVFRAANAVYMTNFLGETVDYENFAECVTNEAFKEEEEGDKQIALLRKARNLYSAMVQHVEISQNSRKDSLNLFTKATELSIEEWSGKLEKIATAWALYTTSKKNYEDAKFKAWQVKTAAIVLTALIVTAAWGAGLWAWWGIDLRPKERRTKATFRKQTIALRNAHKHTYMDCNYTTARAWDLRIEMEKFEELLAEEKKNKEEKKAAEEKAKAQTSFNFLKMVTPKLFEFEYFIPKASAQDMTTLQATVEKIQKDYKSMSDEDIKGGQGDAYIPNIPPFPHGTPAGAKIVENYEKIFKAKEKVYQTHLTFVETLYAKQTKMIGDLAKWEAKYGKVADGKPHIPCRNQVSSWIWKYVSEHPKSWLAKTVRNWQWYWRNIGCTRDLKAQYEKMKADIESMDIILTPMEHILDSFETAMDKAQIDWLTALNLHETGSPDGDPQKDNPTSSDRVGMAYAKFIAKIKGEWMTSSMNVQKNNNIYVDYQSDSTLERLLNEKPSLKSMEPNKKAGFSDPYTRYIYMQYAQDLLIKNLALLGQSYQLATDQLSAFQNLLAEAEAKLGLDATAMPDQLPEDLQKKPACAKGSGGGIAADPSCSCQAKGNCAKINFPKTVAWKGKGGDSGAVFRDYSNSILKGDANGARVNGQAIKRSAAAIRANIEDTKNSIIRSSEKAGYQSPDFNNLTKGMEASINKLGNRNAVAAAGGDSSLSRRIRRSALLDKTNDTGKALEVPTVAKRVARAKPKSRPKKKGPVMGEGMNLGIDESDLELEGGELEGGIEFTTRGRKKAQTIDKASTVEKRKGVVEDDTRSLWDIVTNRYKRSGYPRLLKKRKK